MKVVIHHLKLNLEERKQVINTHIDGEKPIILIIRWEEHLITLYIE